MLVCFQIVFLSLSNLIRFTEELYTKTLQLNNHDIHVQSDMYADFALSQIDKASYDASDIKDFSFNSAGTELNVKFINKDACQWCKIDCNSSDTTSEISIGGCAIKVHSGGNNEVHDFVTRHKFKLTKNTKYDFAYHSINFKLDEIGLQYFGVVLTSLVIELGDHDTCEIKNTDFVYYNPQFNSPILVTLCKSENEKIYTESYALDQPKPAIEPSENEKQEEIENKEPNDQEQGNKEEKDNKDDAVAKDEDNEEMELRSTKNIVIISISVVLILISLVIICIYIFKKGDIPAKIQRKLSSR